MGTTSGLVSRAGDSGATLTSISLPRPALWEGLDGFHPKTCHAVAFSDMQVVVIAERQLTETLGSCWEPTKLEVTITGSAVGANLVGTPWPGESWAHRGAGFGRRRLRVGLPAPKPISNGSLWNNPPH